jgi:hypothetical protein
MRRSQWPSGLRRGFAVAGLVGLRIQIPPAGGCRSPAIFVCFKVEVCATDQTLVQRNPAGCGVSEFDRETS